MGVGHDELGAKLKRHVLKDGVNGGANAILFHRRGHVAA
jgi:hypothetical protein